MSRPATLRAFSVWHYSILARKRVELAKVFVSVFSSADNSNVMTAALTRKLERMIAGLSLFSFVQSLGAHFA